MCEDGEDIDRGSGGGSKGRTVVGFLGKKPDKIYSH
jgi:hypothetical protein